MGNEGRVERVKGIEPSYAAWEAAVLPLNYTRARRILGQREAASKRTADATLPGRPTPRGAALAARKIPLPMMASTSPASRLTVNGEPLDVLPGSTVADLVATLDTAGKRVAVERNGEIVPRSRHATTVLAAGDRLEIVIAVGGG